MQQAHKFKRNLFTLKIVGNTFPTHSFFPNTFLSPPQKMPERLLGVLCKHLSQWIFPQCHSFPPHGVPGHTAPAFPRSPGRSAHRPPAWDGCSRRWPPGPEPSCRPTHPPRGIPCQLSHSSEHGRGSQRRWLHRDQPLHCNFLKSKIYKKYTAGKQKYTRDL